jgi:DNA-binding CsgD family transcriptional regulator
MGLEDAIDEIVDGAYAAALDQDLWFGWNERATELLGGKCGYLYVLSDSGELRHQTIVHPDPVVIERYVSEEIYRYDPQIPHVLSMTRSGVYRDIDHIDPTDPRTAEFIAWHRSNSRLQHYVTACARLDGGRHMAGLSVHQNIGDGPTSAEATRIMQRLLPDIGRAMALGFSHAEKLNAAYWDGLLARQREPSALIDRHGRILLATSAFEMMMMLGDGLTVRRDRLACAEPATDDRLRGTIEAALLGKPPRAGACQIGRPSGRAAYILTAYPLVRRSQLMLPDDAVALVTIVDPAGPISSPDDHWAAAFGLTARETELATMLMGRHSIDTAAATLSITSATARVHLRNIFAKTGTGRQSELTLLLSRLR